VIKLPRRPVKKNLIIQGLGSGKDPKTIAEETSVTAHDVRAVRRTGRKFPEIEAGPSMRTASQRQRIRLMILDWARRNMKKGGTIPRFTKQDAGTIARQLKADLTYVRAEIDRMNSEGILKNLQKGS